MEGAKPLGRSQEVESPDLPGRFTASSRMFVRTLPVCALRRKSVGVDDVAGRWQGPCLRLSAEIRSGRGRLAWNLIQALSQRFR
jgi:hypothetical protein